MDSLTTAAASGMRSRMEALDLLANNIANSSAPGFKADREFYAQYVSAEAAQDPGATVLPVVQRNWTDFSQGALVATGNPLDIALSGKGFLAVKGPSGVTFTRDGSLHISPQGELQTNDGYAVQEVGGKAIQVDPAKTVEIAPDGTIRQDGQDLSRIAVVDFPDLTALNKRGHAYFSSDVPPVPSSALVEQGKIESANSQPAENAVRLVGVMRQFEMLQRALSIGTEMNKRALEEVARVAS